jgi:N-formylmaleamate deformylase
MQFALASAPHQIAPSRSSFALKELPCPRAVRHASAPLIVVNPPPITSPRRSQARRRTLAAEVNMKTIHVSLRTYVLIASFALLILASAQIEAGTMSPPSERASIAPFSVTVTGQGKPMILIPGLASSGDTWAGTVAHLKARYTCYVLTLAGFAGVPPVAPPLLSKVRGGLATLIEQRHLIRPVIVGHSLGGNIALDFAARYPQLAGPVIIVDSLPFYAGAWFQAKNLDQAKPIIARMRQFMESETPAQYEATARSGVQVKYMVTSPKRLQEIIGWSLASDPKTVNEAFIELVSHDLRPELAHITSPTLVLGTWKGFRQQIQQYHANLTRADFVATFKSQYTLLPHLHFTMCDTARHFIMFDDPNWFYSQLDAFLSDPSAATQNRGFGTQAPAGSTPPSVTLRK